MREEECEYLNLLYEYLKSHFGSPQDPAPNTLEEKTRLVDVLLKRYLEHDNIIRRELELYLEILDLRQELLKELLAFTDTVKALCKGGLDDKMRYYFLNSGRDRLISLLEVCKRLRETVEKARSGEGETASKLIIYYIKDNHEVMLKRLKKTVNLFERALKKFERQLKNRVSES